jgi:hypothetical protein
MANLIDVTSNILAQNTICFDTRNINPEHIPTPIPDAKFGILNFTAVNADETNDELEFLLVVDCSDSMSDVCPDGKNKMQYIIHTLKNIILFFHERSYIKMNVTINTFDDQFYSIVTRTRVSDENLNEIICNIEKITPRGITNIESALRKSAEEITKLKTAFPNHIINHIFMTDGKATDGSTDIAVLKSIVKPDIHNVFIGFGLEHDAYLLNAISSQNNSSYYFIDRLEHSGLIYGEILHKIVYKLLTNAEIIIENGLVYNFKTNTWSHSLVIDDIVSEANKTYNIISSNPDECKVNIKGRLGNLVILFPSLLVESKDLTTPIYRQRTLQLLYEVNEFCYRTRNTTSFSSFGNNMNRNDLVRQVLSDEADTLKLNLLNFMEEMKKYIADNNLQEDRILKNLCDDIYVCFRTFETQLGVMFCGARQISQGNQRQYTPSSIDIDTDDIGVRGYNISIPVLQRRTNGVEFLELYHTLSSLTDTPYSTPQATQVMNEINSFSDDNDVSSILTQSY